MKKIFQSFTIGLVLSGLALGLMLGGCEDVNEQFDQKTLDSLTQITNIANYTYTLADADYSTIGTRLQKPTSDSLALLAVDLKNAANHADSLVILDSIANVKLRKLYVYGGTIKNSKYFSKTIKLDTVVPWILKTKFKFGDENSVNMVTYNLFTEYDTTTISGGNKYTLLTADYDAMGTSTGHPGKYDNFDATMSPAYFLPIWLKANNPYALVGDVKLIRYKFYAGSTTTQQKMVFTYDGAAWVKYSTTAPKVAKFKIKGGKWVFIDSDILLGLKTDIGSNLGNFNAINVAGDQLWAWDAYGYMKVTGYVSGSYYDNEDWLVSPPMNFTERINPILSFDHVGRYFGDATGSNVKMKIAITVWVSTTSDGTSIVPAQWTKLTLPEAAYPSGSNWTFITSGPISLTAYKGLSNVRIAFKYLSSAADNAAGTWEVKNAYVYEP